MLSIIYFVSTKMLIEFFLKKKIAFPHFCPRHSAVFIKIISYLCDHCVQHCCSY